MIIMSGCMCQNVCQKNVWHDIAVALSRLQLFGGFQMVKVHKLSRWDPQTIPNMLPSGNLTYT